MSNDQDFIAAVNKAKAAAEKMTIFAEGDENTSVPAAKPYPSAHKAVREVQQQIVQDIDPFATELKDVLEQSKTHETNAAESAKTATDAVGIVTSEANKQSTRLQNETDQHSSDLQVHVDYVDEVAGKFGDVDQAITEATVQADRSKSEADKSAQNNAESKSHADRAKQISGIEDVQDALRLAAVPAPDFHLPLISDLQIREGFGEPDQIDVSAEQDGSLMVDLPTRSASFSRASKKTLWDKSGVLTEVEVDIPALEKNGIRRDGESTNLDINSKAELWSLTNPTYNKELVSDPNISIEDVLEYTLNSSLDSGVRFNHETSSVGNARITVSVLIKPISVEENINLRLRFSEDHIFKENAVITIKQSGVEVGSGDELGSTVSYESGGWYRFSTTYEPENISGTTAIGIYGLSKGAAGDVFRMGCSQVEPKPFVSPYIPTNGIAVTRAADILSFSVPNNFILGDTTTFIRLKVNGQSGDYGRLWDGGNSNQVYIANASHHKSSLRGYWASDANWGNLIDSEHWFDGISKEITVIRKPERIISYHNGVNIADIPASEPGALSDNIFLGNSSGLSVYIQDVRIWHHALSPEQIASLG